MEALTGTIIAEPMPKPSMLMGSTAFSFSHTNPRFHKADVRMNTNYSTSCKLGLLGKHKHETFKCKQISFKDFAKIEFPGEVPQFIEDFFMFMAGHSLRSTLHTDSDTDPHYIKKLRHRLNAKLPKELK